jgi:uncharacterized repeat protein (TIGR01451 family)
MLFNLQKQNIRMKKNLIITILFVVISRIVALAQSSKPTLDQMLVNIDKTLVTSGIIYERTTPFAKLTKFNLTNNVSNTAFFEQAITDLYLASNKLYFSSAETIRNNYTADNLKDIVDIGIINAEFSALNYDIENPASGGLMFNNNLFSSIPNRSAFINYHKLIIAPLKTSAASKSGITFNLNPNLIFANSSKAIKKLTVNFGDGIVNGDYEIITDTVGIYGTNIIQPNFYTATPQSYSYNINSFDTTIISDYTLQNASQPFDSLSSYIIPLFGAARPGFSYPVGVTYTNEGNALLNSSLRISYDSNKLHFNSTTYVSLIDSGKFLLIPASNLLPGQRVSFMIDFTVKSNAVLGDTIKLVSTVNTLTVSCIDSVQTRIVGSFDPNDIQATESLTTVQVAQSKPIKYIIRFENTGTDTAFNVVIKDQLSNLLNKNSIELISSSHSCKISVKGSIVSFTFNKINLPDSNKNKIACHGFVAFYIKPVSTVSAGVDINNSAAIYFDYNKAVLTNTALTKIKNPFITPLKFISYELKSLNENNSIGNTQTVVNLWKTANEMNVHHFNVQRSFNGKDFVNVGEVAALNEINNDYSFIDVVASNLLSPIIYYRLEAIDKDGSKTYSGIKNIITKLQNLNIQVYPNPAINQISIQRKTDKVETVSIIDIDGKIVKKIQLNKFLQTVSINELQKGIYLLKFEHSEMIKLIKQ